MDKEEELEQLRNDIADIHRSFLENYDYESLDEYIADMLFKKGYRSADKIFEKLEYYSMDGRIPMNGYYYDFKNECVKSEE